MLRLRNLEHTEEDFKLLASRCKSNLSFDEINEFHDATLLTKTNRKKNEKNISMAENFRKRTGKQLIRIPSVYSTQYARIAPDDEAEGLKK